MKPKPKHELYECGICNELHPWNWDGDCREDANRFSSADDYAARNDLTVDDVEVFSWAERLADAH
jgi:hypothetical protein